jgi:superfamily II DNA/RNA helicase
MKITTQSFKALKLSPVLLSAIKRIGFTTPTQIQMDAIPAILDGSDVLAGAETGSGKTAAFALPLLQTLIDHKKNDGYNQARGNHVRALILVPTRELAIQIREDILALAQMMRPEIRCLSVYGGVKINPQMMAMRGGVDVLISTPGRLLDLADHNALKFNKLQTLVLDEADRLVGSNFQEEIEDVFKILPKQRQNLLFTATFPESVRKLVRDLLNEPIIINLEHSSEVLIDQHVVTVNHDKKNDLLAHLLNENDWRQVLIFCSAKKRCDNLVLKLEKRDIQATALHGDKAQKERITALEDFKAGTSSILIATDVASRGIDIEKLDCVINYELPRSPNDYIHRIGRTGRAGTKGQAITLIAHHEYAHFSVIEKRNNLRLAREQVAGFEADRKAPSPPTRDNPRKKNRKKLTKKQRAKMEAKKVLRDETKVKDVVDSLYGDKTKITSPVPMIPVKSISAVKPRPKFGAKPIKEMEKDKDKNPSPIVIKKKLKTVNESIWGKK